MSRRFGEPVVVRVADGPVRNRAAGDAGEDGERRGTPAAAPVSFLWRGRLYVVREVLGHWRERRAWWTAAAARAVHGDMGAPAWSGARDGQDGAGGYGAGTRPGGTDGQGQDGEGGNGPGGTPVRLLEPGTRVALDPEREVWRVEAGAGRSFGVGVYDLCHEGAAGPGAPPGPEWHLLRVTD